MAHDREAVSHFETKLKFVEPQQSKTSSDSNRASKRLRAWSKLKRAERAPGVGPPLESIIYVNDFSRMIHFAMFYTRDLLLTVLNRS